MRKNISKLASLSLIFLLSLSMVGCNKKENYNLHTEKQEEYLKGDYNLIHLYADGTQELSKPQSIALRWDDFSSESYEVKISKKEDFSEGVITHKSATNMFVLENMEINQTYYWKVCSNGKETKVESFTTNSLAPRSLVVDGITNARDVGGYKTLDGEVTNQGLIYRTSRFNENETQELLISSLGKMQLRDLGIKTELDIRRVDNNENGGLSESPLGPSVNYISVPMKSGGNCILLNKDILKDAFKVFGNKDNYPIVMHCSIGTDRTGMLAFLINALLGVSEEDLYKDYLYSNFANIGGNRTPSTIKSYIDMFKYEEGDTLALRVKNYLLGVGVNEIDINNMIDMMK